LYLTWLRWAILGAAILPSLSYLLIIFAARSFFRRHNASPRDFTPPVSVLKPVRGLDPEAYENFASFCRQDYPEYEILFAVTNEQDPATPVIRQLIADFPALPIRLLVETEKIGSNDKVNKLCGLARAARYSLLVLSDADIRVGPDYLRSVAAPFRDAKVGAVTSMFTGIPLHSLWPELEAIYLSTDFMPAVLMAQQLEGVRFALGATVGIRRECLAEIGGFEALADEAADDHELGCRTAARGHRVELVEGTVKTWCCPHSLSEFFIQRLRWAIMARQARPLGYVGYIFAQGLPWTVLAVMVAPTRLLAGSFVAAYLILRMAVVWTMGVWGLHDDLLKRRWWLVPLWDAFAFVIWLNSLVWSRVCWRGVQYRVAGGRLIPVASPLTAEVSPQRREGAEQA
jgi:ceramide glucosyltransferase